jgi:prepilin-type N-terminal cleavage/methylation domain-containing protein
MKKGFTLIELLVVIGVISVLMSVLMPALNKAKEQAKTVVCRANLKSLSISWVAYAADNGEMIVGSDDRGEGYGDWVDRPIEPDGSYSAMIEDVSLDDQIRGIEAGLLFPYSDNAEVYHCPSDRRYKTDPSDAYRSYSFVCSMNCSWEGLHNKVWTKTGQIPSPGTKIMALEDYTNVYPAGDYSGNWGAWIMYPKRSISENQWHDRVAIRHRDTQSVLAFADGHSELHTWEDQRTIDYFNEEGGEGGYDNPDLRYMQNVFAPVNSQYEK